MISHISNSLNDGVLLAYFKEEIIFLKGRINIFRVFGKIGYLVNFKLFDTNKGWVIKPSNANI